MHIHMSKQLKSEEFNEMGWLISPSRFAINFPSHLITTTNKKSARHFFISLRIKESILFHFLLFLLLFAENKSTCIWRVYYWTKFFLCWYDILLLFAVLLINLCLYLLFVCFLNFIYIVNKWDERFGQRNAGLDWKREGESRE